MARAESLTRQQRVRDSADYSRCYRTGRRHHGSLFVLYCAPNQLGHTRLGITVSRKVGNAVRRQRMKRRIRETYRRWSQRSQLPASDLVVHARPKTGEASHREVKCDLERLLGKLVGRRPAHAGR